jgi:hypothetical protein
VKNITGDPATGTILKSEPKMYFSYTSNTLMIAVMAMHGNAAGIGNSVTNIQSRYCATDIQTFPVGTTASDLATICLYTNYTGAWYNYFRDTFNAEVYVDQAKSLGGADTDAHDPLRRTNVTLSWTALQDVKIIIVVTYDIDLQLS